MAKANWYKAMLEKCKKYNIDFNDIKRNPLLLSRVDENFRQFLYSQLSSGNFLQRWFSIDFNIQTQLRTDSISYRQFMTEQPALTRKLISNNLLSAICLKYNENINTYRCRSDH